MNESVVATSNLVMLNAIPARPASTAYPIACPRVDPPKQ